MAAEGHNNCYADRASRGQEIHLGFLDPLRMGPIGCPEASVRNYHSALGIISGERRSYACNIYTCFAVT